MIERIDDMPPGSIGFSANGKLTRDDYRNVLEPVLHGAAATYASQGGPVTAPDVARAIPAVVRDLL